MAGIVELVSARDFERLKTVGRTAASEVKATGIEPANKLLDGYDPVTPIDLAIEAALIRHIEEHFPNHSISSEERGYSDKGSDYLWSIDPVDGTRALVCGLPTWATLVGLLVEGKHVAGMIDLPAVDETYISVNGKTRRNGQPVRTNGCTSILSATITTTDPFLFCAEDYRKFTKVRSKARTTRYGLDAFGYARVASGEMDLVIEAGLKPHDLDALVSVIRGAGGHFGDWVGGSEFAAGNVIAAASEPLYSEVVALLAS